MTSTAGAAGWTLSFEVDSGNHRLNAIATAVGIGASPVQWQVELWGQSMDTKDLFSLDFPTLTAD
jgi:hypothetical protein